LSRSPSKPMTPIKISNEEAKIKAQVLKASIEKLNSDIVEVLRMREKIKAQVNASKAELDLFAQTTRDENKAFLANLKKAVENKNPVKVTYSITNPFIKKHQEAIKEALRRKGYPVDDEGMRESEVLTQSQPISSGVKSRDTGPLNSGNMTNDSQMLKTSSRLYSKSTMVSQSNPETDIVLEKLQAAPLKNVPSYIRSLAYSKIASDL
jgi:hypothetical protein